MGELLKRITNESPSFFKKIQAIGITVGAVGTAILALPTDIIALPEFLTKIAGYMVAAGLVAAAIAKTTVKDAAVLEKKDEKVS